jgi:hypothetical protein
MSDRVRSDLVISPKLHSGKQAVEGKADKPSPNALISLVPA